MELALMMLAFAVVLAAVILAFTLRRKAPMEPPAPDPRLDALLAKQGEIGGQFNVAKQVPGKEEFYETLRYFRRRIDITGVKLQLDTRVAAADLGAFDEVILATGISPRQPPIARSRRTASALMSSVVSSSSCWSGLCGSPSASGVIRPSASARTSGCRSPAHDQCR